MGPALAAQTHRLILAETADAPVPLHSTEYLNLKIKKDLIASLEELRCGHRLHETQEDSKHAGQQVEKKLPAYQWNHI